MFPAGRLAAAGRWLADVAFPRLCAGCDTALVSGVPSEFCPACLESLPWIPAPVCEACGEPFTVPNAEDAERFRSRTCVRCRAHHPAFARARAAFAYEGPIRHAVHAVKFRGRRAAASALGALLVQGLERIGELPVDADAVVPVPLHPARLRERGYNQAALVGARLAAAIGRPLEPDLLRRERAAPPQVGLDRASREENVRGAFSVPVPARVAGRRIVLVDDVLTTGATASACAGALVKAGAQEVRVAVLARG